MFKKTMKFDDLDGNEVEQTFYFNYNKKEIAELLEFGYLSEFPPADAQRRLPLEKQLEILSTPTSESGLSEVDNNKQAYDIFQDLILDAYGVKGEDNVSFDKSPELRRRWKNHVAFVELIFEFLENPPLAAEFVEKCLPPRLVATAKKEMQRQSDGRISEGTLLEMSQEANRRQQDPATRIEPGTFPEGESAEVVALAKQVAEDGPVPAKNVKDLTPEDILEMDEIAFKKLDIRELDQEQMLAAFKRKTS